MWNLCHKFTAMFAGERIYRVGQKMCHLTFVHIFIIIDQFSKFFHWHTLQTICDNNVIIDPTTL